MVRNNPAPSSADDSSELRDILGLLDALNLVDEDRQPSSRSVTTVPQPPEEQALSIRRCAPAYEETVSDLPSRHTPVQSLPVLLPRRATSTIVDPQPRLYEYHSPSKSGLTPHWEEAAYHSQRSPGGSSRRLTPSAKSRTRKGGYAVFVGRRPGPYHRWDEVEPLVKGVSGTLYQGYMTYEGAVAAFKYAEQRSWTRTAGPLPTQSRPPSAIPQLPTPIAGTPNPLHDQATPHQRWYIVYCGIFPGVYSSTLECSLNTLGLSGAVHDSCESQALAEQRYQDALLAGRVKVVTPMYSLSI
ncbi:hypothetical protein C8F04DRAFT_1268563 [Mycena alexandri]|uniref:Ribonuclease H1 N-terminal domain-containing protein n=1 Tax=Mycena alexandri TaxID=1745969 RepID=A0AAD6WWM2_9AGAR|nr:hypothetical protein C8F04DRAFT_1268563 [Mycena alexandri]